MNIPPKKVKNDPIIAEKVSLFKTDSRGTHARSNIYDSSSLAMPHAKHCYIFTSMKYYIYTVSLLEVRAK